MKRNNEDQMTSTRKKLKFGVDAILGNDQISTDHQPEPTYSPILLEQSTPSYPLYGSSSSNDQQSNILLHSLWQQNLRPYWERNEMTTGNEYYFPPTMSNLFWTLDNRTKVRPRMLRRAVFSDQQRKDLETVFQKQKYINKPERKKLAQRLGLKESQVDIEF